MTKGEAKDWLERGWKLNETINKKLEEQCTIYNLACSSTSCPSNERVQSGHKNTTEDILIKYIDISDEIDRLTDELYNVKRETWQAINQMDNKLYKKILKLRFVYFKPWGYIAQKINISSNTVRNKVLSRAIDLITQYIV